MRVPCLAQHQSLMRAQASRVKVSTDASLAGAGSNTHEDGADEEDRVPRRDRAAVQCHAREHSHPLCVFLHGVVDRTFTGWQDVLQDSFPRGWGLLCVHGSDGTVGMMTASRIDASRTRTSRRPAPAVRAPATRLEAALPVFEFRSRWRGRRRLMSRTIRRIHMTLLRQVRPSA
jgi:hypothetical protein